MSTNSPGEWLSWFDRLQSEDAIREAAYTSCTPIPNLSSLQKELAAESLNTNWMKVFVPSEEHVKLLKKLIEIASAFAQARFPSINAFNRLRSSPPEDASVSQQLLCLTGLAGVSKTSLMEVFQRILALKNGPRFATADQIMAIHPVRRITISGHLSVASILKSMANPVIASSSADPKLSFLQRHVRDWLGATATCALVVDEMQSFTTGSNAHALTSQFITTCSLLGVPVIFVANYSLGHKLFNRPHEEKDRQLARPLFLSPPSADDPVWPAVIGELLSISPDTFKLNPSQHADEIHRYTGGLYRALRELLVLAYREVRDQKRFEVTIEDIQQAYRSRSYSARRIDLEALASLSVSPLMEKSRPDLVCPFQELKPSGWRHQPQSAGSTATSPTPAASIPEALIQSTLSTASRDTLRQLRKAAASHDGPVLKGPSRPAKPKAGPVTADALLQGEHMLRNIPSKPRGPAC